MNKIGSIICLLSLGAFVSYAQSPSAGVQQPAPSEFATQKTVIDRYCETCQSDRIKTASLSLQNLNFTRAGKEAEIWERVIRKVRAGLMPPPGAQRPDRDTLDALAAWLENEIDGLAATKPAIVRPGVH